MAEQKKQYSLVKQDGFIEALILPREPHRVSGAFR